MQRRHLKFATGVLAGAALILIGVETLRIEHAGPGTGKPSAAAPPPPPLTPPGPEPVVQVAAEPAAPASDLPSSTGDPGPATEPLLTFVWQPFHSEVSARGFARNLEQNLAYPMTVKKAGPGRYRVGFSTDSAEQRERILQQIAQITGVSG